MSARTLAVALVFGVALVLGLGLVVVTGAQSPVTVVTDPGASTWCGQITRQPVPWRP